MLDYGFDFQLSSIVAGALRIVVIVVVALILIWILKRVIHRVITARMPRVREETPDQVATRADTLSGVISKVAAFIIWLIAGIMILGALGINIAPIIASKALPSI